MTKLSPRHKLYQAIAKRFEANIASGKLHSGARLPPQRELADQLGVSLGTVTRAYAELEKKGLISGHGRRGTFVGSDDGDTSLSSLVSPDATGHTEIDLGGNYPPTALDPPLAPALQSIANQPSGQHEIQKLLHYAPTAGWPEHRSVGAAWIEAQGVNVDRDDVIVTAGAQHGIATVLSSMLSSGDTLFVGELTYPGVLAVAAMLGITVQSIPMDEEGIDPDALAARCRKHRPRALYCVPTLQNPTTVTMPASRKRRIAELAMDHDFWILEDEIHRLLVPRPPPAFYTLCPSHSFFISSVSKVVAGGLRLGFLAGPEHARLLTGLNATMFSTSALNAEIFARWWERGVAMNTVRAKRNEAKARHRIARRILGTLPGTLRGSCSYHLWLELPPSISAHRLIARSAERGVRLLPPETFAADHKTAPNALRLCLGAVRTRAELERGLEIIASELSKPAGLISL